MTDPNARPAPVPLPPARDDALPRWTSQSLLGAHREAVIEHRGERYRLRLTSAGKLILTK